MNSRIKMISVELIVLLALYIMSAGFALAQDIPKEPPELSLVLGVSSWFNNCDVPQGAQDTGIQPSFGPNFQLGYGKFIVSGRFFFGDFDVEPEAGIHPVGDKFEFIDEEAIKRGFTSGGKTKRLDVTLNVGYEFSRAAVLSVSFIVNRHEVDLDTFWFPKFDAQGDLLIPTDPDRPIVPFKYTDTQYWLGQDFSGSIPVETVSAHFSIFYSVGLLIITGETGSAKIGTQEFNTPRVSYTDNEGKPVGPGAARGLPSRSFSANAGVTLNIGAGFQLFEEPNLSLYGGYNFKFFGEGETNIIDHSRFHGPFFGLSWTVK